MANLGFAHTHSLLVARVCRVRDGVGRRSNFKRSHLSRRRGSTFPSRFHALREGHLQTLVSHLRHRLSRVFLSHRRVPSRRTSEVRCARARLLYFFFFFLFIFSTDSFIRIYYSRAARASNISCFSRSSS